MAVTSLADGEPGADSALSVPACGRSTTVSMEYGGSTWLAALPWAAVVMPDASSP